MTRITDPGGQCRNSGEDTSGWLIATGAGHWNGLVNQHDRDVVPYRVGQPAVQATDRLRRFVVMHRALALWTSQNIKKIPGERHLLNPFGYGKKREG
jgi:hypothetical protein